MVSFCGREHTFAQVDRKFVIELESMPKGWGRDTTVHVSGSVRRSRSHEGVLAHDARVTRCDAQ